MQYFDKCKNKKEAKKLYRKLAKRLHPDVGGNSNEFILMMEEYRTLEFDDTSGWESCEVFIVVMKWKV